jgi:hypothetical protein
MKRPARIAIGLLLAMLAAHPGRAGIIVNWLDTPTTLFTDTSTWYLPLDLNGDGFDDFTFGVGISSVSVQGSDNNQYLILPAPPPNIGGYVSPVQTGYEIGPNSGDGELDWYNSNPFYSSIVIALSGPGGYVVLGEFPGQRAYMGVAFDIQGAIHYGWIDMYVSDLAPGAVIYGWGYESTPGMSIIAGAVPEPSTIVLMLTGSLALFLSRAKRQSANNRLHNYG